MRTFRLDRLADLTDPASLGAVSMREEPMSTVGFSGATHRRLVARLPSGETRRFVLKLCDPTREWTATRSGDRIGREWSLLAEPALDAVWDAFVSPYVAYAVEGDRSGLLMEDLGAYMFPDVREPIARPHEDELLAALARLHARFWRSPALSISWLGRASSTSEIVCPAVLDDAAALALMPSALRERLRLGWDAALARLSARATDVLRYPTRTIHEAWDDLPPTLVHGDVKVANFALIAGRGVSAFDWALIGVGPSTTDLGWYLAVNASRLAQSKEGVITRYRELLERELGHELDDGLWTRLEDVAVIYGARTMLWAKGAQLAAGGDSARIEWEWWARRLEDAVGRQ
ncbi:MAG TPA: phosphotransferase [Gemmatimonadaceae bacterium]|nr:phosphotransferase [Gemmatimonadaceae bacterium]